jgi:hypothetical protein
MDTTTAGLRVPNLGQVFSDLSVAPISRGNLTQVEITVVAYSLAVFTFTNNSGDAQSGLSQSASSSFDFGNFVSPAPLFGSANPLSFVAAGSGPLLGILHTPSVTGVSLGAGIGSTNIVDSFVITTNTFSFTGGADFAALASQTDAFTALPVLHRSGLTTLGLGNYSVSALTYSALALGITYSFVPESDLAWVGLPLVVGGWLIRRRMVAGKKA